MDFFQAANEKLQVWKGYLSLEIINVSEDPMSYGLRQIHLSFF